MAYRPTSRRAPARRSYGARSAARPRARAASRRAPAARRAPARGRAQPQTIKLVLETRPSSPVSRPDLTGVSLVERPSKKAKF